MTKQPHSARRPWAALFGRCRVLLGPLPACVVVAAVAAFALDEYQVAERRREMAAEWSGASRSSIPAPDYNLWKPTLLSPGTAAPQFTLVDVRTGARVSLDDYRGQRPVVLLLSSFG